MSWFEVLNVLFGWLEESSVAWTSFIKDYRKEKYYFKKYSSGSE